MFFSEHQLDESHALPFRNGVGFIYKVASLSPFACSVRTVAPVPLSALFTGCPCGIGRNPVGKLIRSGLRLFRLNFILITIYVSAVGALGLLQLLSISFPAITTSAQCLYVFFCIMPAFANGNYMILSWFDFIKTYSAYIAFFSCFAALAYVRAASATSMMFLISSSVFASASKCVALSSFTNGFVMDTKSPL